MSTVLNSFGPRLKHSRPLWSAKEFRYGSFAPKKALGQHFLANPGILGKIADALDLSSTDRVLEIGPGQGALTAVLLEKAHTVLAVEIDPDCVYVLKQRFGDNPRLKILQSDFLKTDPAGLLDSGQWKAAGNLPYNVAAPILFRIFGAIGHFDRLVFMFQEEVARRITAQQGTRTFGFLSVACQLYTRPRMLFRVRAGSFRPPPKVDSAVVEFVPRKDVDITDKPAFLKWVEIFFQQRRKLLSSRVARTTGRTDIPDLFAGLGISAQARPEDVSTDQWIALYSQLFSLPSAR